jgi:hypothetical protein
MIRFPGGARPFKEESAADGAQRLETLVMVWGSDSAWKSHSHTSS